MSLEKREIFRNRFRYVCATCSFNWPRTPLPESELPPPPRHSCRGASQPLSTAADLQASPAQAEKALSLEPLAPKANRAYEEFSHSAGTLPPPIPESHASQAPTTQTSATRTSIRSKNQAAATRTSIRSKNQAAATKNPLDSALRPTSPRKDKKGSHYGAIKPRPVAVCTRCQAVSYDVAQINGRCANQIRQTMCVGVNGSALHQDDWKLCPKCSGSGTADRSPCGTCNSAGWLYTRPPKRR